MKLKQMLQGLFPKKKEDSLLEENATFSLTLLDTIYNPIFYKDINGVYKHCNTAFCKFLGLKKDAIIGHTVHNFTSRELALTYEKADKELINSGERQSYETKVQHSDGSLHDVIFNKTVVKNNSGKKIGIVGVMIDITQSKLNEKKLQRFSKLQDAMLEVSNAVIGISDMYKLFNLILEKALECISVTYIGTVLLIDETDTLRVAAYKGYHPSVIENFSINLKDSFEWKVTNGIFKNSIIISDLQSLMDKEHIVSESQNGGTITSVISSPILIDNKLYGFINLDSENSNVFDETDLEIMDYMSHQIEIAISRHKLYEETINLSRYDELTKLYNRRYFEEQLGRFMLKAEKFDKEFFLVLFDLNGLKHVNDKNGHIVGDKYIHKFATALKEDFISADMAARIGGDEFVAVFSKASCGSLIERLENLNGYFKDNPLTHEKNSLVVSFSYGIASYPKDGATYSQLFRKADNEMYAYKKRFKILESK
jgi:diguanylate cyclase (GGDEF)-like protein/PAS domain S-box-containing protein